MAGCKDKGGPKTTNAELAARVEKLQAEEGDVLARRDDLKREREQVAADRAALAERRKAAVAAGGDTKALDEEEATLIAREGKLLEQEEQLNVKIDTLIKQYQEVTASGAADGDDVARREAMIASREKDFARREDSIARREADIAAREKALAQREKETCSVGATTTIVQAAPPPKGSKYSRRDVEPLLKKARRAMSDKGILSSDLPAPAQSLEKEATEAMEEGDFGKAKFAADQLYATIDSMKIDKGFVVAKINRLNAILKGKPVNKEVDDLFRGATGDYGDGKFTSANAKLNKIYSLVR